ncbi:MAG: class I SAM-dependent methyltransferase [Chloroflexota bacterium]
MTDQPVAYTFEPFAQTAEYLSVNATIVRGWGEVMAHKGVRKVERVLDIATGVGTMVELFVKHVVRQGEQPSIICLDASAEALEQAHARLAPIVSKLEFHHSLVEQMDLPEGSVDAAVWGNGIHYLDPRSQEQALLAIKRVLKKDGWFCFSSAFYAESRPPETLSFYMAQVKKAVAHLRAMGIRREERQARSESSSFLPIAHYESLLRNVGFSVEHVEQVAARLYQEAWEHISSFSQYAAGALHGYQPDVAANVLREAVRPALEEHGQRDEHNSLYVQRNWLSVVARLGTDALPGPHPARP